MIENIQIVDPEFAQYLIDNKIIVQSGDHYFTGLEVSKIAKKFLVIKDL